MKRSNLSRRGITLVELLATMAVMSSIAAMSGVLLGRLHARERDGRADLSAAASMAQVIEQFRSDAHAAVDCDADEGTTGAAQWSFRLPDETVVRYEAPTGKLLRTELREAQIVRRESFVVPPGNRCRLAIVGDSPRIVVLQFERDAAMGSVAPLRAVLVEAVLARDLRFLLRDEGAMP